MRSDWSIRTQLLALVTAVTLPLVGLLGYDLYRDHSHARQMAGDVALTLAKVTAARVSDFVEDIRTSLDIISRRPFVLALDPHLCDPDLEDLNQLFPSFQNLFTVDLDGRVLCAAPAILLQRSEPLPFAGLMRQVIRSGRFTIGDPVRSISDRKWHIPLAHPLRNKDGQLAGALVATVDLVTFRPLTGDLNVPSGTAIRVLTKEGVIVASSQDAETWVGRGVRGVEGADIALARHRGIAQAAGLDGTERFQGFTTVADHDWLVIASIPVAVAMSEVRSNIVQGTVALVLILAFTAGLGLFVTRVIAQPVSAIADVARRVAEGQRNKRALVEGPVEIRRVATQLNRALDAEEHHERLLSTHADLLRRLLRQLMEVGEGERRVLARELHDRAGQGLTALGLNLNLVRAELPPELLDLIKSRLDDMQTLLGEISVHMRNVMAELRPPGLDEFGLLPALRHLAERFGARSGLAMNVSGESRVRLPPLIETALFRIAEEALTNVAKHARARTVDIRFDRRGAVLRLTISDDGAGISPARDAVYGRESLGMMTMRERAMAAGARLTVDSAPGRGTVVTIDVDQPASCMADETHVTQTDG